uniref:Uncharacterized protein n=1 Tax=Knipowitschia caucasica TaxID=637954 RepID=A0AAV2LZZ4_KNICA
MLKLKLEKHGASELTHGAHGRTTQGEVEEGECSARRLSTAENSSTPSDLLSELKREEEVSALTTVLMVK